MKKEMKSIRRRKTPAEKGRRPWWRLLIGLVGIVLTVWAVLPIWINRITNVGVIVSLGVGLLAMCWGLRRPPKEKKQRKGWRKAMYVALIGIVAAFAALAVVISTVMIVAAVPRQAPEGATVIVLGAKITPGGNPSRMLAGRLNAAARYLEQNPASVCIVSGGQGDDESESEAAVMRRYLLSAGVAEERIIMEDRSEDTHQNIDYSLAIIRERALSEDLVIATQEFHQYRAAVLCRRAGAASVRPATCASPLHLLLCYWVRECAAICRLWLLRY